MKLKESRAGQASDDIAARAVGLTTAENFRSLCLEQGASIRHSPAAAAPCPEREGYLEDMELQTGQADARHALRDQ